MVEVCADRVVISNPSGIPAQALSSFLTAPMELGVTLQQTSDFNKKPKNFINTYGNVIRSFGVKQGMTGLTCVALRDSVVTTGTLTLSLKLKIFLTKYYGANENIASLIAGSSMGVFCAIATHPLDTIKTLQHINLKKPETSDKQETFSNSSIQKPSQVSFWKNTGRKQDCTISFVVRDIYQTSGIKGFYRGLWWRVARVAPHVAIVSYATEALTKSWNKNSR